MSERRARELALEALARIDDDGTYANLVLPELLARSELERRDRAFTTELVYGTTRMRRSLDFLVDLFLIRDVEPAVRRALRLGAYQLHYLQTPAHAAVDTTVGAAPARARGLVNAVLRKIAKLKGEIEWPDDATRLSYPSWIVERLRGDLGADIADAALIQMNAPATETIRDDGYRQDLASQWVGELVGGSPGERIADVCAAPGGKATALAASGARVYASDLNAGRARMVQRNAASVSSHGVSVLVADAGALPYRADAFDRVLVDAPCSGLGALRRRPDARWRIKPASVDRLAEFQGRLMAAAAGVVRPGGTLTYSVCTLTTVESIGVDETFRAAFDSFEPVAPPGEPWRPWGTGALLLPQSAGTDGMALFAYRRRE